MKRKTILSIFIMAIAVVTLGLTSCNKDFETQILGKWKVTKAASTAYIGGQPMERNLLTAYKAFEFQEDGTCLMTTRAINPLTNTVLSDKDSIRHYKWNLVDGNRVHIVTPSGYELNYDITLLNDTKLNLHGKTHDTIPGFPQFGKTDMEMDLNMIKQ